MPRPADRGVYASTLEPPVLLVGTAHVVDLSDPLRRLLNHRPLDALAVELDPERAEALLGPGGPAERPGSGPVLLRLWAALQRRLGEEIGGGVPGAEMRVARDIAAERGVPLLLIDDPIRLTVSRLLQSLSLRERVGLAVGAIVGLFVPARFVERQIAQYQSGPGELLAEVRRQYPGVARVLLDERNEHMAARLDTLRRGGYGRVAAIVGDAHLPGLAQALRRRAVPVEMVPLSELRRAPTAR